MASNLVYNTMGWNLLRLDTKVQIILPRNSNQNVGGWGAGGGVQNQSLTH